MSKYKAKLNFIVQDQGPYLLHKGKALPGGNMGNPNTKRLVSRPQDDVLPQDSILKSAAKIPRIKKHEIMSTGPENRFITSETRRFSLKSLLCPGEKTS